MSAKERSELLEAASRARLGVSELVARLRWKTSRAVSLLRIMEEEGLISFHETRMGRRGRPKKLVDPTPLGIEFLKGYRSLASKPLRSRRVDLERATEDALYADRLAARGIDPLRVFMELNEIVRNISVSSNATLTESCFATVWADALAVFDGTTTTLADHLGQIDSSC